MDFDDGDTEDIDLSEEVWRVAKAEDEAEAQSGGKVAMKEADLANIGMLSLPAFHPMTACRPALVFW